MIKSQELSRSNIISIIGAVANDYDGQRSIVPQFKWGMSNRTGNLNGGTDDLIGFPHGYGIDSNLIIHASWSGGLGIHRVEDDGSITNIYNNTDPSAGYGDANNQSIVLHRPSRKFVIMSYDNNGYSIWDYSPCFNGEAPIKLEEGNPFISVDGVTIADVGSSYYSGLTIAGDWVYAADESATHYKAIARRNIVTGVQEKIDFTVDKVADSATIDRNGYRGILSYDSVNDRVFYQTYYNANMTLITNASTSNPLAVWCDMGDAGLGDDAYEHGVFIPEPTNEPNIIILGCNSRVAKVDITPCFTGTRPTVIGQGSTEDPSNGSRFGNYFRVGIQEQAITAEHSGRNPLIPTFCPTTSDRGRNMLDGWFDQDNFKVVGLYRHNNNTEDTTSNGRGRSYRSDYGTPMFRMQSNNGTFWWVKLGYGYDGHQIWTWDNSIGNGLVGNWSVEWGTYTLESSASVDFVHLNKVNHFIPSGCSLSYYVSNNNGSTWESYTAAEDDFHTFSSSGTQLKVKYVASGFEDKAPYKMSASFDAVTYGTLYESVKDATIPYKVSTVKIRGRKK